MSSLKSAMMRPRIPECIHRQYSYKAAATFPDGFFDFLYLDSNHTYEFVLSDLLDIAPKVKPDGLILGHDYFHDGFADRLLSSPIPLLRLPTVLAFH